MGGEGREGGRERKREGEAKSELDTQGLKEAPPCT